MNATADVDERTLPASPTSAGEARRFASRFLGSGDAEVREVVELLVSELATNAILHARTPFTIRLVRRDDSLRVEVADGSSRPPLLKNYGLRAPTGRGMRLIAALSRRWGVEPDDGGKVVWCEITTGAGRSGL